VGEATLSLVLLICAGLMVQSFLRVQHVDPGFDAESLLTFHVGQLPETRDPEPDQVAGFYDQLLERLDALPGVSRAAAAAQIPLETWAGNEVFFSLKEVPASLSSDVSPVANIYAKSWKSLASTTEEDRALRQGLRESWRVAQRHFDRANPGAVFMDCMPLIRGDEADAEVVDGPRSIRYDEAENRLHAQKAILASLIG